MPITYRCASCGQLLGISSKMAGHVFDCPACGNATRVPGAEPAKPESAEGGEPSLEALAKGRTGHESAGDVDAEPEPAAADSGGFPVRKRAADTDDMDLTPMVDMTFLLLIFFMITASFSVQKSLAFPRPDETRKGATQTTITLQDFEERSIVVYINERNVIHVDDEPLSDRSRLTDILRAAISSQRNELLLTADDNAWHETVVAVIDAASAAGMQKIRLTAPLID
ncbi:MAG: biopolymer transporter ExbD [Planctomycetaceae bacterium]